MKYYYVSIIFLMVILGCSKHSDDLKPGNEEQFIMSPSKMNKAFVWKPELGTLGATISQPYQVWIQNLRPGFEDDRMLAFTADKTNGVRLLWNKSNLLEICYAKAQISKFRNRFIVSRVRDGRIQIIDEDEVEIVLKRVDKLSDCEVSQ